MNISKYFLYSKLMINMVSTKDIPAVPDLFYRSQWKGWDDFLNSAYPYDWELIEIIKLNYNGMGDAIALCDRRLTYIHLVDLNVILFGSQHGAIHYETVATDESRIILRRSNESKTSPVTSVTKPKTSKVKAKSKKSSKNVRKKTIQKKV